MKTLFLLRHAKSSWSNPGLRDYERPLNGRGRKAAYAMGEFMADEGLKPDLVLSSSSERTRETYNRLVQGFGEKLEAEFLETLYHCSATYMLGLAQNVQPAINSLMLIAHNPGMYDAALRFTGKAREKDAARLDYNFPTAGLAVFSFDVDNWQDVSFGAGTLERLVFPKDL